jgi:hypothetical protein
MAVYMNAHTTTLSQLPFSMSGMTHKFTVETLQDCPVHDM